MTSFNNRLTTAEDRSLPFDPFGTWEAEWAIYERDLKNFEMYQQQVSADKIFRKVQKDLRPVSERVSIKF